MFTNSFYDMRLRLDLNDAPQCASGSAILFVVIGTRNIIKLKLWKTAYLIKIYSF
jgi:hypothetical protein